MEEDKKIYVEVLKPFDKDGRMTEEGEIIDITGLEKSWLIERMIKAGEIKITKKEG